MTAPAFAVRAAPGDRASYHRAFEALERAGCQPKARGESGLDALCPVHGDTTPSLSGDWKPPTTTRSGAMMLNCHAANGCTYDDIREALGLSKADLFDGNSPDFEQSRRAAAPSPRRRTPQPRKSADIAPKLRKTPQSKKKAADHAHDFQPEHTHIYSDANGLIIAKIHRKRCAAPDCREKTFRTGYPNGKPTDGVPLYGTPELADAIAEGRTIHICEGEGDRDALTAAGEAAVSAPFGADDGKGSKWLPLHTEQLRGARSVVIWADRDAAGLKHAGYVANQLLTHGIPQGEQAEADTNGVTLDLRIVYPAVDHPAADASDHLTAGHRAADAIDVPGEDLAATGLTGPATSSAQPKSEEAQRPPSEAAEEQSSGQPHEAESDDGAADGGLDAEEDPDDNGEPGQDLPGRPVYGSDGWRFDPDCGRGGAVWKRRRIKGEDSWIRALYWCPKVDKRLVLIGEDGTSKDRLYIVTVGEDTLQVSLADLRTNDGWNRFADTTSTGTKAVREVLVNIVEQQGRQLPRTMVVDRAGWHDIPKYGRTYVFADGRTCPAGRPVEVTGARARLVQAAAPLERTATLEELRLAVVDIMTHGWVGALALSVGVRSLGMTLRRVNAGLALFGERNSGKSSAAAVSRGLMFTKRPEAFPPEPTRSFSHTATSIEMNVHFEADTPSLIEDLALTLDASMVEIREGTQKLEMLFRSAANDEEMRGRFKKDMTAQDAHYVNTIPMATCQMLPPTMQASLYRRAVCVELSEDGGQMDWRWYRDGGGEALQVPLRTLGELVVRRLHELGDEVTEYLEDLDTKGRDILAPYVRKVLPDMPGPMEGVVKSAGGMLAGLGIVADLTGFPMDDLVHTIAAQLAEALGQQAEKMDDRHAAQDDFAAAVADIVRNALMRERAHVRDAEGIVGPVVPYEIETAQGVIKGKDGQWEGKGAALYWLPARGPALGVTSEHLHNLFLTSGDPRVKGIGVRSLPHKLLKGGVTIRNTNQKDRVATHQVKFPGDKKHWLALIKPELLWDIEDDATTPGESSTRSSEKNEDYEDYEDRAGQSLARALLDSLPDNNEDCAGQRRFSLLPAKGENDPGNALTSTVLEVLVQEPGNEDRAHDGAAVLERGPQNEDPAHDGDTNGYSSEEVDDDMPAIINDLPKGDCVLCGQPTVERNEDGQWQHKVLAGFHRCDQGYTDPQFVHLNAQQAPQPGAAPSPASAEPQASTPPQAESPAPVRRESARAMRPAARTGGEPAPADPTKKVFSNGPLAVIAAEGRSKPVAYLADGRTLECPARTMAELVAWAIDAGIGQARLHKWAKDADPVIVLTAGALSRFKMPLELEDQRRNRLDDDHPVIAELKKAGWQLTKRGLTGWTKIYRTDRPERTCVLLGIAPWGALGDGPGWRIPADTAPADIAQIMGTYAQRVLAPRGTMASNGLELLLQLRPTSRPVKDETTGEWISGPVDGSFCEPVKPAPCEAPNEHPDVYPRSAQDETTGVMHEEAWSWHRAPTEEEARLGHVAALDTSTSFLSGSSRLLVGSGDPEYVKAPVFNPKIPGAYRADLSEGSKKLDPRLPNPFTKDGQPPTGPGWYTAQTLSYALELGIEVTPIEAWLRTPHKGGWLDPWQTHLAIAYKDTMAALGLGFEPGMPPEAFLEAMARYEVGEGDPIQRAVLKQIKQTIKNGIGKLRQTPAIYPGYRPGERWPDLDKPWWRPDVRYSVIAATRTAQHRKIRKMLELTGQAPLAAYSDCVVYPATAPSALAVIPRTADGKQIPGAFRLGIQPGWVKQEGTGSMAWYIAEQQRPANPAIGISQRPADLADGGK